MTSAGRAQTTDTAVISAIVPMIHVIDMQRSVAFYRLLGFEIGNYVPREEEAPMHWCWLYSPKVENWKRGPNLMLTASECAIDVEAQEILFYLYAVDLQSIRKTLLDAGVAAGEIEFPEYLPEGEFHVKDPDGYTLMIAQAGESTP
jgi:catechol 2,3-dioxygenase-like lactoylglutathione lyase family enzyme